MVGIVERTVKDLIELAPQSVDSEWSIKSKENGTVSFKYENRQFKFTGVKRMADVKISDTSYNMIYQHFVESQPVGVTQ